MHYFGHRWQLHTNNHEHANTSNKKSIDIVFKTGHFYKNLLKPNLESIFFSKFQKKAYCPNSHPKKTNKT